MSVKTPHRTRCLKSTAHRIRPPQAPPPTGRCPLLPIRLAVSRPRSAPRQLPPHAPGEPAVFGPDRGRNGPGSFPSPGPAPITPSSYRTHTEHLRHPAAPRPSAPTVTVTTALGHVRWSGVSTIRCSVRRGRRRPGHRPERRPSGLRLWGTWPPGHRGRGVSGRPGSRRCRPAASSRRARRRRSR